MEKFENYSDLSKEIFPDTYILLLLYIYSSGHGYIFSTDIAPPQFFLQVRIKFIAK